MSDNTIKTVKLEFDADVKGSLTAFGKLVNKLKEVKNASANTGMKQMASEAGEASKKSVSAIDSQIKKIATLKNQLNQLSALYKQLQSDRQKLDNAEIKKSTTFEGTKEYQKASERVNELRMQLQATLSEVKELFGTIPTNSQFEEAILRIKMELAGEEQALKQLQKAEQDQSASAEQSASATKRAGESAKQASSKHGSFAKTLKNVGNVLKNIKSHVFSAISGMKNLASSIKGAIPGAKNFGGVLGKLASQFKRLFVMRILRNIISSITKGFKEGIDNVVQYSAALNGLDANNANKAMSEFASTTAYLKNVLGSAAIPVLNQLLPIIRAIATGFATAVNYVNQFFSLLGGKTSWTKAKQTTVDYASTLDGVGSSAGSAKDSVEGLKRTILGFDEINKLNDASGSSGGSGGGSGGGGDTVNYSEMFEEVPISNEVMDFMGKFKDEIDNIKDAWGRVKDALTNLTQSDGFKYIISEGFRMILGGISTVLDSTADTLEAMTDILNQGSIKNKVGDIGEAWDGVRDSISKLTKSDGYKKLMETVTFVGLTAIETALKSISGFIEAITGALDSMEKDGTLDGLQRSFQDFSNAISGLFNSNGFKAVTKTALYIAVNTIKGLFDAIGTVIREVITPALDNLNKQGVLSDMKEAVSKIWENVNKIVSNKTVQALLKGGMEAGLKGLSEVLQAIASALETISKILSGDFGGAFESFTKTVINALSGVIEGVLSLIDAAFHTNLASGFKEEKDLLIEAIDKGMTVEQVKRMREAAQREETNQPGVGATPTLPNAYKLKVEADTSEAVKSINELHTSEEARALILQAKAKMDDALSNIQDWISNVWNKVKPEDRQLAFEAFISSSGSEVANMWHSQAWEKLSDREKELAWQALIETAPESAAAQFTKGWNDLNNGEKFLAFLAYINSAGSDVAWNYIHDYWIPTSSSAKTLEFAAKVSGTGDSTPNKIAKKYIEESWNKATINPLAFQAKIDTSDKEGGSAPKRLFQSYVSVWEKLQDRNLPVGVKNQTTADNIWNPFKTSWGNDKKVDISTQNKTTADNIWSRLLGDWSRGSKYLQLSTPNKTTADALWDKLTNDWGYSKGRQLKLQTTNETTAGTIWNALTSGWYGSSNKKPQLWTTAVLDYNSQWGNPGNSLWNDLIAGWYGMSGGWSNPTLWTNPAMGHTAQYLFGEFTGDWNRLNPILNMGGNINNNESMLDRLKTWFGAKYVGLLAWFYGDQNGGNLNSAWSHLKDWFGSGYIGLQGWMYNAEKKAIWDDLKDYFAGNNGYSEHVINVKAKATSMDTSAIQGVFGVDVTARTKQTVYTGGFVGAASGRLFDSAQVFTARENGIPEYVGKFGSHTAVANNYQIVSGIAEGVSKAMLSQNELLREQNALLAQIASNSGDVTTSSIVAGLSRQNRRAGTTIVSVGV